MKTVYMVELLVDGLTNARRGEYLFEDEAAARAFAALAHRQIQHLEDPAIVEVRVYASATEARAEAWPFEELRP